MSGSKDGQILFHGILLATARGLASKTAINWHLKVKNVEYNVGLTTPPNFDQAHPKNIEITFCFPEFVPPSKKSVHFINSSLRYSQF